MRNTPCSPTAAAAVLTAWSVPLIVAAAMIFPPVLLAIPVVGVVVAVRARSRRKAAAARAAEEARYLDECWTRWNALPR